MSALVRVGATARCGVLSLVLGACATDPPAVIEAAPAAPSVTSECAEATRKLRIDEGVLRNWGGRGYFDKSPIEPGGVIFLGDSILANWAEPDAGGFFPGKPYDDRGIRFQTTAQMLVRFRGDVVDARPAAVFILGGINDIVGAREPAADEEIVGNLASMAEIARANGVAVVLATLLPVGSEALKRRPLARVLSVNTGIRQLARTHAYGLADLYPALADEDGLLPDTLSADGLHPNAPGYARLAPVVEAALALALKGS